MEKCAENCKISQKFEVLRQILDEIGLHLCENLHCLKDILISFHIFFFLFHEKILSGYYVILKFTMYCRTG